MIAEGLLTTVDTDGNVNVAPMGPIIKGAWESLTLRPFAGSTTFDNLVATRRGVFHVVDRVNVIAEAAVRQLKTIPDCHAARQVDGVVLADCCRWFELEIDDIDTTHQRSEMQCRIVYHGEHRPFWGFNRARHAVIEAAILATRVHLIPGSHLEAQFAVLASAVEKTGGAEEANAFRMLSDYVAEHSSREATS